MSDCSGPLQIKTHAHDVWDVDLDDLNGVPPESFYRDPDGDDTRCSHNLNEIPMHVPRNAHHADIDDI